MISYSLRVGLLKRPERNRFSRGGTGTKDTMAKTEETGVGSNGRPIRRAVIAEAGRELLDRLNISQNKIVRATSSMEQKEQKRQKQLKKKRQMSERSQQKNQPSATKVQKLKVDPDQCRKPGVIPKMWTPEEDKLLEKAIAKHGERNWRAIADMVPNRSYIQCLQRWKKALRPGLRKGHWSKEEDASLLKLVEQYKPDFDWSLISKQIPGRNAKQCRERWFLNLDPSINHGPWTPEEDEQLLNFVAQLGGRWALISKHIKGRTENSVKTRFHSLQRKEARNRKWSKEEDDKIIEAVLKFGREFDKIDAMIPGRTKGQIKKRFSILAQQKPDLIRNVYAVEEAIRQRKAAEAMATSNVGLQAYPSSFLNPNPSFARPTLTSQNSFAPADPSLLTQNSFVSTFQDTSKTQALPPHQPPQPPLRPTLKKSHSARVIEDILKPNQVLDDSVRRSKKDEASFGANGLGLQRFASSGLNRFLSSGPSLTLQGLNQTLNMQTSPPKPPAQSNPNMAALDKLFDETKSNGAPKPSGGVQMPARNNLSHYPQSFTQRNPLVYNQMPSFSRDSLLKRTSTLGMDQALAMPQYDASGVLPTGNSVNKKSLQRAGNSIGSVGLRTYDSSDMKSLLNLL